MPMRGHNFAFLPTGGPELSPRPKQVACTGRHVHELHLRSPGRVYVDQGSGRARRSQGKSSRNKIGKRGNPCRITGETDQTPP